jgi:hypothetical protein
MGNSNSNIGGDSSYEELYNRIQGGADPQGIITIIDKYIGELTNLETKLRGVSIPKIKFIKSIYNQHDPNTHYKHMINDKIYKDALFIFNDNLEQFLNFEKGNVDGCNNGGGNAEIRSYRCISNENNKIRAAGIVPGTTTPYGGFMSLDEQIKNDTVRKVIKRSMENIEKLLKTGDYSSVIYSGVEGKDGFGFDLFKSGSKIIGSDVENHIWNEFNNIIKEFS